MLDVLLQLCVSRYQIVLNTIHTHTSAHIHVERRGERGGERASERGREEGGRQEEGDIERERETT